MAKTTIKRRMITRFGLLFFFSFLLVLLLSRFLLQVFFTRELQEDIQEEMAIINSVFREELRENLNERTLKEVAESIRTSKKRIDLFQLESNIELFTRINGKLKAVTSREMSADDLSKLETIIKNENFNKLITVNRQVGDSVEEFRVYVSQVDISLRVAESSVYAVIYVPVTSELDLLRQFTRVLLLILTGVYLLTMLLVYLIANRMTKPIKKLEKYAIGLSESMNTKPIEIKTDDEIEQLGVAMNKMADEISNFNEEQRRFLQNASHELKTPLMSIRGYAEAVMDGVVDDQREALETIVQESERLKRIVNNLSLLSKLETKSIAIHMEAFDLNDCMNDSVKRIQTLAEQKDIAIESWLSSTEEFMFYGDRDSLLQVMINLIGNGIRYANEKVMVETKLSGDTLIIDVVDDGNGIKEKMIPHVFERFYKGQKGQTGLGLSIVKAIVDMHEGTVQVENSVDYGARFTIRLPIKSFE